MNTTPIEDLLDRRPLVLMDGGMGSTAEDRGVQVRNHLWGSYALLTPKGREVNDRLHEEFASAGAEILTANTHNALLANCRAFLESEAFEEADLPAEVAALSGEERVIALHRLIHRRAVTSARRAVPEGSGILVAAGMGSPEGPYAEVSTHTPEEIRRHHEPQIRVYRELGVEFVLFETLTTEQEMAGVALLARAEGLRGFGVGLTCVEGGATYAGVSMARAVEILAPAAPAVYFVQCTPYEFVEQALDDLLVALPDRAVAGVYANDGRVWIDMRWHGPRVTPTDYAAHALRWRDAGARLIGGCCGTGPEHIRRLRAQFPV